MMLLGFWLEKSVGDIDKETKAIGEIAGIMGALEEDQRGRVVRYIVERFNIAGNSREVKLSPGATHGVPPQDNAAGFEDFASLVDAARPETDPLRALVAGY